MLHRVKVGSEKLHSIQAKLDLKKQRSTASCWKRDFLTQPSKSLGYQTSSRKWNGTCTHHLPHYNHYITGKAFCFFWTTVFGNSRVYIQCIEQGHILLEQW